MRDLCGICGSLASMNATNTNGEYAKPRVWAGIFPIRVSATYQSEDNETDMYRFRGCC